MKSAKGKTGEKAVLSPCCRDETTTCYDRAFCKEIKGRMRGIIGGKCLRPPAMRPLRAFDVFPKSVWKVSE